MLQKGCRVDTEIYSVDTDDRVDTVCIQSRYRVDTDIYTVEAE